MQQKKNNRRSLTKYPALDPRLNLKSRQEENEFDYLHKLNAKELEWLNSFVEEDVNCNFNHDGIKVYPRKKRFGKIKGKTEAEARNNARNQDVFTLKKTVGDLVSFEDIREKNIDKTLAPEEGEGEES
jgi:hypothetical protein